MVKTTSSWYNDAVRGKGYTALTLYFCCPIYSFCSANSFEMAPFIVTSNQAQAVLWADQWIWGSLSASPHQLMAKLIYFILIQLGLESCFSLPKVDLASPSHFATHLHPQLLFSHCFSYFVFFFGYVCALQRGLFNLRKHTCVQSSKNTMLTDWKSGSEQGREQQRPLPQMGEAREIQQRSLAGGSSGHFSLFLTFGFNSALCIIYLCSCP